MAKLREKNGGSAPCFERNEGICLKTVGLWGLLPEEQDALAALLPQETREDLRLTLLPAATQLLAVDQFELLAVSPLAKTDAPVPLPPCRLLLLPGTEHLLLRRAEAACVMSYGPSCKDSLSLSSIECGEVSLSIQREWPTLWGGSVERQELQFPLSQGEGAYALMFRVGLLLTLGLAPHELPALLSRWTPPRP